MYNKCMRYGKLKFINSITFDISRFGKHKHTLKFPEPVPLYLAVEEVEDWLSEQITEEYFNKIKNDTHFKDFSYEEFMKRRGNTSPNKGEMIRDCIFLERINIDKNGNATIWCGS